MTMASGNGLFKRCGCLDPRTGRRLGSQCPQLAERGHGSWYFRLELPPGKNGRRRQLRRGGFASRKAAGAARDFLHNPTTLDGASGSAVTVAQWLRLWLESRENLAPSTMRSYAMHTRRHLIPHLGREPVAELTPARLQAMFTSLIRTHAAAGRPLSTATLQRIHATLRAALNAAVRRGLLVSNPARFVELPSGQKPHPVVWTPTRIALWQASGIRPAVAVWTAEQTAEFLAWLRHHDHPLYVLFHLVALLGLRRGEAAGLQWADVDLRARTVTVARQVRQIGKHLELAAPKSASSNRVIALDHVTATLLQGLRIEWLATHPGASEPVGFLFPDHRGAPLRPDFLTVIFRRLNTASGLPPVRLHDLRHGAASLSLAAGNDLRTVQALLGHSSITLTADTYATVLPDLAHHAAEATARLLHDATGTRPAPRRPVRRARSTRIRYRR
ncbi:tyrosine-type recombinase/integrase [Amycolatopsis sp. NPDC005003]